MAPSFESPLTTDIFLTAMAIFHDAALFVDGCGIHLRDAPLTCERVLLALEALAEESSE